MAATVTIRRWTGASGSPTKTNITSGSVRFCTADNINPGTSYPIPIPAAGTKYSYWVVTRLSADTTPAAIINNIKWYTDGAGYGTGVACKVQTATAYTQATGTEGDSGSILNTTNYPTLAGATVDAFTETSASPLAVAGSISNPSTGDFGDFVVLQLEVDSTASQGILTAETFSWRYDEI
jgi:hypothetical protein